MDEKNLDKKEKKRSQDFNEICIKNNIIPKKILGTGGFGIVKEVEYKGKIFAGKLTERKNAKFNESDIITEFKGPNIMKVVKRYTETIDNVKYDLIIMEKATLRDLKSLIKFLHKKNTLKLIYKTPFENIIGDNFVRYFLKNVINGFECLDRNDLIHFDIKPENILI